MKTIIKLAGLFAVWTVAVAQNPDAEYSKLNNMSYVEVNSNRLSNVGCYIRSDNNKPFFALTSIFAGNINGSMPNEPLIYFNDNVMAVLKSTQVRDLQAQGIKVLMTLLGNHENAGWSCMTDEAAANKFAGKIVAMVKKYQLDGVDIDDEYSTCATNNYSMIMLAQAIKSNPDFKGKLLTKALFADGSYFTSTYKGHRLAEYLDYGWEMSYGSPDFEGRLAFYLENGMSADRLMIGGWAAHTYPDPYQMGQFTADKSLAGSMVYDITRTSQQYLTQILNGQAGREVSVNVAPDCLK